MKTKRNISSFTLVLILFLILFGSFWLYMFWSFNHDRETKIIPANNGKCSEKLRDYMEDWYGIYIPENAEFVGGYFTNAFKDNAVYVAFDINVSDLEGYHEGMTEPKELFLLLTQGNDYFPAANYDSYDVNNQRERFGRIYVGGCEYSGRHSKGFSYLVCSDPKKDTVSFLFRGTGCGNSFK